MSFKYLFLHNYGGLDQMLVSNQMWPSGTQMNTICIILHVAPYNKYILEHQMHLFITEDLCTESWNWN